VALYGRDLGTGIVVSAGALQSPASSKGQLSSNSRPFEVLNGQVV
jgi:hypothetical protein